MWCGRAAHSGRGRRAQKRDTLPGSPLFGVLPPGLAPGPVVGGDQLVVGEDDGAGGEFGLIHLFERSYRRRTAVRLVRGSVGELKQMDEPGRVVLLLPGGVRAGAGLVRPHSRRTPREDGWRPAG